MDVDGKRCVSNWFKAHVGWLAILAHGFATSPCVYSVGGGSPTLLCVPCASGNDVERTQPPGVSWSPDGKFLYLKIQESISQHAKNLPEPKAMKSARSFRMRIARPTLVTRSDLFLIFLKAGLAFGGGLGILGVLEDELVERRGAVTRKEFLTIYGIGRIVPSGTMTALAVAYGYKFGGLTGTVIALAALSLPVFVLTVALTVAYHYLRNSRLFDLLPVTIMPAALALIAVAALKLGKDVFRPSRELIIAGAAFALAFFLRLNPASLLLAGGVLGAFVLQKVGEKNDPNEEVSRK